MRLRQVLALCLCVALCGTIAACGQKTDIKNYSAKTMQTSDYFGTTSILRVYDDFSREENQIKAQETWNEVKGILEEINQAVSVEIETSDIAHFNAVSEGETIEISSHTAAILKVAKQVWEFTEGIYDPTIYPMVDLWGFTPRFNKRDYTPSAPYDRVKGESGLPLPDQTYLTGLLPLVDFGGVTLSGNDLSGYTLTKTTPPVVIEGQTYQARMDLGGIAKGYAADLVVARLREKGYEYGHFSCGSSSMALLKSASSKSLEQEDYRYFLGIRKPREGLEEGRTCISVAVNDECLSTSGDYDHSYIAQGIQYSHLINPRTGWPVNTPTDGPQRGIAAVTALGGSAAYDDALTTALCIMGLEDALRYINQKLENHRIALILYHSEKEYYDIVTNLESDTLTINDPAYRLACAQNEAGELEYTGTLLD